MRDHVTVFARRRAFAVAAVAVAVALASLASPGSSAAHLRSGTVAVDYTAKVFAPDTPAYTSQIFQSDHALSLTLKRGHEVTALGYLGEPMFRLESAGLLVNRASLTAASAGLVKKSQRIVASSPRWHLEPGKRSVTWQDARSRSLPPGGDTGTWSVPLIVDGQRALLRGELHRLPAPLLWPWLAILASFFVAGAFVLTRGRETLRPAAIAFAALATVASVIVALAFALDAYASPGTWIAGADELIFLAVGLWVLRRGPDHLHVAAAIGLGLLGLAIGISKGAIFLHPIVLAVLPGTMMRLVVVAAVGAGIVGGALGGALYAGRIDPVRGEQTQGATAPAAPHR
jgi:hypothetical protein